MAERIIKFEGSWEPLISIIEEAVINNELLEIALPRAEYERLKKLNGNFFCGKGLREGDLPKDISNRLFLIPGNSPKLSVGHPI
jgi:hypothetical protein